MTFSRDLVLQSKAQALFFQNGVLVSGGSKKINNAEIFEKNDELHITIQPESSILEPIRILFYQDHAAENVSYRIFVRVLEQANLVLSLEYVGEPVAYQKHTQIEITLGKHANLECYELRNDGLKNNQAVRMDIRQAPRSTMSLYQLQAGEGDVREDIHVDLEDSAEIRAYGLALLKKKQKSEWYFKVNHLAPHTKSTQCYKTILSDEAYGVWSSRVHVFPNAKNAVSVQKNKNILLHRTAEIHAQPELQIDCDAVSCTHGATIGKFDAAALFYLTSRGIPEKEAREILISAFTKEIFEAFQNVELREWFLKAVDSV